MALVQVQLHMLHDWMNLKIPVELRRRVLPIVSRVDVTGEDHTLAFQNIDELNVNQYGWVSDFYIVTARDCL